MHRGLHLFDGFDSLLEEVDVRVSLRRLLADGLKGRRVLLQMLRRPAQEVLQVEAVRVGMTCALLQGPDDEHVDENAL